MRQKSLLTLCLWAFIILFSAGCVNRTTSTINPGFDLVSINTIYVTKFTSDGRGINVLISDKLKSQGFRVNTGTDTPTDVDAVVTYKDKWRWDITMYMLELQVSVRDPKTNFPLASAESHHSSLTRKSPEEMVDEVIDNIFKQGNSDAQK